MRSLRTIALASAASAAVLAPASPAAASPRLAPAAASQAAANDLVQTAVAAGQFKTLTTLVKRAGLAATLQGKGPFTVLAPTDAAFAKVPKATLAKLAADKAALRSVLLYHVAKGRLTAGNVVKRRSIEMLNGETLRVRVRGKRVFLNGARVTTPDVRASNGVIHVINRVLIPAG
jgi:uncharacterized surface protein with fasciclin (FAS1) repeats